MAGAARTRTSSFGVNGRTAHDATAYYDRAIYSGGNGDNGNGRDPAAVSGLPAVIPAHLLNRVTVADAADPGENRLPDNSVHLMVTSPPYCVGKDYDEDLTLEQYLDLLNCVWTETERVLVPGGRVCINIANVGRKPYIPLHSYIIQQMLAWDSICGGKLFGIRAHRPAAAPLGAVGSRPAILACGISMNTSLYLTRAITGVKSRLGLILALAGMISWNSLAAFGGLMPNRPSG